ncbi:endolytic transglycosylase MltG [Nakamurella multipartita]|uniref:Endolytic murein transglycosylase n=1 Tax=Nakamurella multipartita (strain ATCC 700099 / DSM 44233 / CIP 104796 / JCM 9543 / NBRC 105858 / Y-104) TaxID=479431 RepID=C8XD22_NAKMY|nr:endolytic transglycosylase MltG [Nakamurella multipartita]ACV79625.1 aminodeoxychorismate lyase [Nakamurella multipartita DSM 44233]
MNDHLIFGREPGETGDVDVDELKAALAANPDPVDETVVAEPEPSPEERAISARRRHRTWLVFAIVVLLVIVAGLIAGFVVWRSGTDQVPDHAGTGDAEVVVRIQGGDGINDIAATLQQAGVVASTEAFVQQAARDGDVQALKPGYYKVRLNSSAQAAADALVAKENHVGHLRLIPGRQLADVTTVSTDPNQPAATVPGYISDIAAAACVPLNGQQDCFTADELWQVATTADPATLGVVEWAADAVRAAPDPRKRLEGTILPGDFDIPPGSTPEQALKAVVSASAAMWNGTDIIADAAQLGMTPYQAATIASIVEREGITADMPKVARVIDNRLATGMKLEMDSTVNYALDRASIATSADDRANPSPWNTYYAAGLPPTPISSPGPNAIAATLDPAAGSWLFFVKIDNTGASCFSITVEQHDACVAQARANGVFG